jgi:hypothetical protein
MLAPGVIDTARQIYPHACEPLCTSETGGDPQCVPYVAAPTRAPTSVSPLPPLLHSPPSDILFAVTVPQGTPCAQRGQGPGRGYTRHQSPDAAGAAGPLRRKDAGRVCARFGVFVVPESHAWRPPGFLRRHPLVAGSAPALRGLLAWAQLALTLITPCRPRGENTRPRPQPGTLDPPRQFVRALSSIRSAGSASRARCSAAPGVRA